ncbi:hypothetical protein GIB67_027405 [Kingdonia uniflora]|uniref:Uncharacterized protein n=1 Tax=Kingdonia uniflora TaxID=39325 RepID=A0A7J7MFN7_9MAGN|nr:hypothetical protein GIB67_027405 [Kingdonia uniflora]
MKLIYDRRVKAQGWDQNFVVTELPCVHAYCVISHKRLNWVGYYSEYHMVSFYVKTYSGSVLAISDPSFWSKNVNIEVLPPPLVRGAGRPRKVRMKGDDEGGSQHKRGGRGTHARGRGNSQTGRSRSGITEAGRGNTIVVRGGRGNTQAGRGGRGNTAVVRGGRGNTQAKRGGRGNTVVVRGGRGTTSLSQEPIIPTQGSQTSKQPSNNPYKKLFRPPKEVWLI